MKKIIIKCIRVQTYFDEFDFRWNVRVKYGDYIPIKNYTGLQGFVVEKLWVVSGVIFDVEYESGIRISLSRQDFEIFEVMCSKNGIFCYFWGYVQGARNFFGFFPKRLICHHLALLLSLQNELLNSHERFFLTKIRPYQDLTFIRTTL